MKAFILLSGGVDSTTCLYLAIRDFGKENVRAFSVDYGQLHKRELEAARAVCIHAKVPHQILVLSPQPASPLTSKTRNEAIPDKTYDELGEGVSPSYHYFRNGQLLSLITAYADADLQEGENAVILAGQHAEDARSWAYPDCTFEFLGAMANAIYVGTYFRIRLSTPLVWLMKTDVVKLGESLGVPWKLTYSCYRGGSLHCNACPTCKARHKAFVDADIIDPTEYAV